jgi:pectin methylesterase-like acyl-CoA thioesterase
VKSKLIALSIAFVFFLLLSHEAVYAQESITNLDTGERFWTIQEAIDDADTRAGHTLSATAGLYNENLTLHKAIRLVGTGSDPAGTVISQTQAGAGDSKIGVVQIVTSGLSTAEPLLLQNLRISPKNQQEPKIIYIHRKSVDKYRNRVI